mgnify:CR=1 FL=1
MIVATSYVRELVWRRFDDLWIVYQPSSAETHVFNQTTSEILKSLGDGAISEPGARTRVEQALGLATEGLTFEDFLPAVARLQELGLIDSLAENPAHP